MGGEEEAGGGGRGRPEQRAALLDGVVEYVLREGVATLSLRPLAAALGTSDRMLLYYFGSRDRMLVLVLTAVGERLRAGLEAVTPAQRAAPGRLLAALRAAFELDGAEPILRLYVEVSGLAARGREPFGAIAAAIAEDWLSWAEQRLDVPAPRRRSAAAGVLAVVDGLLLLRFVAGETAYEQAADWLAGTLDLTEPD
ncbi:hypothetical protein [Blastococcus sp. SYSU D01042]